MTDSEKSKRRVKVRGEDVEVVVEVDSSETSLNILHSLPATVKASLWGDEVYFSLPVECCCTNMHEVVQKGDVAYWDTGKAMCLFFGPTPASRGDEIRPASAVHVFGRVVGDPTVLAKVGQGEQLTVEIDE